MNHATDLTLIAASIKEAFPGQEKAIDAFLASISSTHDIVGPGRFANVGAAKKDVFEREQTVDAHRIACAVKKEVFGQDEIVDLLAAAYADHNRAGIQRPFSVLILGSDELASTSLARSFAKNAREKFVSLDAAGLQGQGFVDALLGIPPLYSKSGRGIVGALSAHCEGGSIFIEGFDKPFRHGRADGSEVVDIYKLLNGTATCRFHGNALPGNNLVLVATAETGARRAQDLAMELPVGRLDASLRKLLEEDGLSFPVSLVDSFDCIVAVRRLGFDGTFELLFGQIDTMVRDRGLHLAAGGIGGEVSMILLNSLMDMDRKGIPVRRREEWLTRLVGDKIAAFRASDPKAKSIRFQLGNAGGTARDIEVISAHPAPVDGKAEFLATIDAMEAVATGGRSAAEAGLEEFWRGQGRLVIRAICGWLADSDILPSGVPMPDQLRLVADAGVNVRRILAGEDGRAADLNTLLELAQRGAFGSIRGFDKVGLGLPEGLARVHRSSKLFAGSISTALGMLEV